MFHCDADGSIMRSPRALDCISAQQEMEGEIERVKPTAWKSPDCGSNNTFSPNMDSGRKSFIVLDLGGKNSILIWVLTYKFDILSQPVFLMMNQGLSRHFKIESHCLY